MNYMTDNKQNNEISLGDKVEIEIDNGTILEGKVIRFPEIRDGVDIDKKPITAEYGWGIVGKIKDSEESEADWEIKIGQYKKIKKINS